mmetsp:Transcript_106725/g.307000  ORF Transcript_106725/g.307000 Transcript_106725/m.307000 type:complete len:211 (-) Transcript_106725:359-991(-)
MSKLRKRCSRLARLCTRPQPLHGMLRHRSREFRTLLLMCCWVPEPTRFPQARIAKLLRRRSGTLASLMTTWTAHVVPRTPRDKAGKWCTSSFEPHTRGGDRDRGSSHRPSAVSGRQSATPPVFWRRARRRLLSCWNQKKKTAACGLRRSLTSLMPGWRPRWRARTARLLTWITSVLRKSLFSLANASFCVATRHGPCSTRSALETCSGSL